VFGCQSLFIGCYVSLYVSLVYDWLGQPLGVADGLHTVLVGQSRSHLEESQRVESVLVCQSVS